MYSLPTNPNTFPSRVTILLLTIGAICSGTSYAQSDATLEERVGRLERAINSETLVELLQQVERLQQEVQELRGELEVQAHEVSQLKKRQRELYLDIDRRMGKLETSGPPIAAEDPAPATGDENSDETVSQTGAASADVDPGEERDAYQIAFDLLKAGRYEDAASEFSDFLSKYPTGNYSDNAQYWLGEAYYVTRAFEPALAEFQKLVKTRPDSAKVSHALLKMGYIQDELGQKETAKQTLSNLIERFPGTTAARLAKERLQELQ